MKTFRVDTIHGEKKVITYNINDFPYSKFEYVEDKKGYVQLINMFDIETTTIDKECAFMYHWQICIQDEVVFGRTWEEYITFIDRLHVTLHLSKQRKLVIYVHNLSFEFQFMCNFFHWDSVFAKKRRSVLKAETGNIEYRCSYFLTNMSLYKACINAKNCTFIKKSGDDFDYKKIRYPWTKMDEYELSYCYCDVKGGVEMLKDFFEDDDCATIPLTSTGFVRRDCRNALRNRKNYRQEFIKQRITPEVYNMLEELKRGGNTHANRAFVETVISNVRCFDIRSAYPYVMLTGYYPASSFTKVVPKSFNDLKKLCKSYCVMMRLVIEDLEVNIDTPIPYIPFHKLLKWDRDSTIVFNGRVLYSKMIMLSCTEIDFEIIESMYTHSRIAVHEMYIAKRGQLPLELKKVILDFFRKKTELKGVDDYLYEKSKNKLNSIFGMTYTNPVHDFIEYNQNNTWTVEKGNISDELEKYYKSRNSFLNPTHGAWVTAHCRKLLQSIIDITGEWTLYCDTDSDKCIQIDDIKLKELNNKICDIAERYGAYIDYKGERIYLGIFEEEKTYKTFKTMGAKKYAYTDSDDKLHITIAGVNKLKGADELKTLDNMKQGFTFYESAGSECFYNDYEKPFYLNIDGRKILTGSNIAMLDGTYTLGLTKDFIENKDKYLNISGECAII